MFTFIYIITVGFLFLYVFLICYFIKGWKNLPHFEYVNTNKKISVSVVIACKNEVSHLPNLLKNLKSQSYTGFELILVNDHSTDASKQVMDEAASDFVNIKIIDALGFGKKKALKLGIESAKGDLIITTDADCMLQNEWVESIVNYQNQNLCDLIIGPVIIQPDNSWFSNLQKLEFVSLVASGAGAVGINKPIMCNGANLAFTKAAWLESNRDLHEEEISGDDIFLLQSIKKKSGKICFLKNENAKVYTLPEKNIKSFFNQRVRWASKSKKYTDKHIIFTAILVFTISFLQVIFIVLSAVNINFIFLFLAIFFIKYFIDCIFLYKVSNFFELQKIAIYSLFLSMVYPIYILYSAIYGLFITNIKWK